MVLSCCPGCSMAGEIGRGGSSCFSGVVVKKKKKPFRKTSNNYVMSHQTNKTDFTLMFLIISLSVCDIFKR